jgi:hypothetical protein
MGLSLGSGDVDEIGFAQSRGLGDDRRCDGDIVVVRKLPHQVGRGVGDRREAVRHGRAHFGLDFDHEAAQHVVEQRNVLFIEL